MSILNILPKPESDEPGPYTRNILSAASRLGFDDMTPASPSFESLGRIIDELARRVVELEAAQTKPAKGD